MSRLTDEIIDLYPVRKTAEQKKEFRGYLKRTLQKMGYSVAEEKNGQAVNVIAGDPAGAKYILSAGYDTAAKSLFPNFISVTNAFVYVLYQALTAVLQIAVCFLVAVLFTFAIDAPGVTFPLFCVLACGVIYLSLYGPASRHNANANSSGLGAVLEIAEGLSKEARKDVAFVFFDKSECGMKGSSAYRKRHKNEVLGQIFFHFYCVGQGDELLLIPNNRERWDEETITKLEKSVTPTENKRVRIIDKGLTYYPTDQRKFRFAFLVGAFSHKPFLGYYQIRSGKKSICDSENISLFSQGFIKFIEEE